MHFNFMCDIYDTLDTFQEQIDLCLDDIEKENNEKTNTHGYTSDGVTYDLYIRLKNEQLIQADCCQLYFRQNVFEFDQTSGYIDGLKMCIHCFFVLNLEKFNKPLSPPDKNLLDKYLIEFSKEHNMDSCKRAEIYGMCFLCNYLKEKETKTNEKCRIYDKIVVKNKPEKFTLYM